MHTILFWINYGMVKLVIAFSGQQNDKSNLKVTVVTILAITITLTLNELLLVATKKLVDTLSLRSHSQRIRIIIWINAMNMFLFLGIEPLAIYLTLEYRMDANHLSVSNVLCFMNVELIALVVTEILRQLLDLANRLKGRLRMKLTSSYKQSLYTQKEL